MNICFCVKAQAGLWDYFISKIPLPSVSYCYENAENLKNFQDIIADSELPVKKIALPAIAKNKRHSFADIKKIRKLFEEKKFFEIEKYYSTCFETRLDYDSRDNMRAVIATLAENIKNTELLLEEWRKENPASHLPCLLLANYYINKAWESRGSDWASKVTEEGWKGFHKYLKTAHEEITAAYQINPADPNIASTAITVALGMGLDFGKCKAWFDRAISADPYHTTAYCNMMYYMLPKWYGSWELSKSVCDEAIKKIEYNSDLFLPLRSYYIDQCCVNSYSDNDEVYNKNYKAEYKKIYYSKLKSIYEELSVKYPDAHIIHALYCYDMYDYKEERKLAFEKLKYVIKQIDSEQYRNYSDPPKYFFYNKYAWTLSTSKNDEIYNPELALFYAKKAVDLMPEWEWSLDTLAGAYAANGDFKSAIETQIKAKKAGKGYFKKKCDNKIAQYEKGVAPRY